MTLFEEYLEWAGGVNNAAKSIPYTASYLYMVRSGKVPMTKSLAENIEKHSGGKFNKIALIWPDEIQTIAQ